MITEKVINSLYKTYNKRPASADELDIDLLFEHLLEHHDIEINDNAQLIINSIPKDSPFHSISLNRIHAIVEFKHKIAIVLPQSIIFLNKKGNQSHIHIKDIKANLFDRIFSRIHNI